jgi:hypothetical protein
MMQFLALRSVSQVKGWRGLQCRAAVLEQTEIELDMQSDKGAKQFKFEFLCFEAPPRMHTQIYMGFFLFALF